MIQKIRIELINHAFSNFTIQSMPLYQGNHYKLIMTNPNAFVVTHKSNEEKSTYKIHPLSIDKGEVYIYSPLIESMELEVINKTKVNGILTISNLSLNNLKTTNFKEIYIENSSIHALHHSDKKKVKLDDFSKIGKIIEKKS